MDKVYQDKQNLFSQSTKCLFHSRKPEPKKGNSVQGPQIKKCNCIEVCEKWPYFPLSLLSALRTMWLLPCGCPSGFLPECKLKGVRYMRWGPLTCTNVHLKPYGYNLPVIKTDQRVSELWYSRLIVLSASHWHQFWEILWNLLSK